MSKNREQILKKNSKGGGEWREKKCEGKKYCCKQNKGKNKTRITPTGKET
jgi:hypothetical protein